MFGIGFTELIIIFLAAVIFIRPDDIPSFFRKLGKIFAEIRGFYNEVVQAKDDFLREVDISAAEETAGISHDEPEGQDDAEPAPSDLEPANGEDSAEGTDPAAV